MNYGTLETELATRLNAYFAAQNVEDKFEAIEIPQNEAEQNRPFQKSRVTVQYFTSAYQPTKMLGGAAQAETITMRLTFEARNLREDNGFYALIEHVKHSLLGYQPANCSKALVIDKYDLVFYENNTISPYLDMQTETQNLMIPAATDEPLFKDLTIESQCPT